MRLLLICVLVSLGAASLHSQTGSLAIQNVSSTDVVETYVSPSSSTSWGPDLGGIGANSTRPFTVPGGDFYDLWVIFANTDEMEIYNIWVGSGQTVTEQVDVFDSGGGGGGGDGDDENCTTNSESSGLLCLLASLAAVVVCLRQRDWAAGG